MKGIEEILGKIGLTTQESRVYLALLELQEAKTGHLCAFTKIASSNIYKILESLMKKGLVSYRIQNNVKVFMPAPPDALNELFIEKQRTLEDERKQISEVISKLKKRPLSKEPYSNYKYYEGMAGVKSLWHEINTIMRNDYVIRCYTAKKESYARLLGFYNEHHKLRKKQGIKEHLIFPKEDIELAKTRRNKVTEIRFMDLENDTEWGVVKDRLYIQYITGKQPRAFLIKDETFAKTFEQVFDQLWEQAKP